MNNNVTRCDGNELMLCYKALQLKKLCIKCTNNKMQQKQGIYRNSDNWTLGQRTRADDLCTPPTTSKTLQMLHKATNMCTLHM